MEKKLEDFLALHNRLSPSDFQATMEMVFLFRKENATLFASDEWSAEEMRRPFLAWMRDHFKKSKASRAKKGGWVTFPRPSDQ